MGNIEVEQPFSQRKPIFQAQTPPKHNYSPQSHQPQPTFDTLKQQRYSASKIS